MRSSPLFLMILALLAPVAAGPASAQLPLGATAPPVTKSLLGGGSVIVPSQYSGKVLVLFLLGYG